jgi:hypothetical protein
MMEKETFLSGYCRTTDQSRMVEVITENGKLLEVDCCYENCIHAPNCSIAQQIRELMNQ